MVVLPATNAARICRASTLASSAISHDQAVDGVEHQGAQFRQPLRRARVIDAADDVSAAADLRLYDVRVASTCPFSRSTNCAATVVVPMSTASPSTRLALVAGRRSRSTASPAAASWTATRDPAVLRTQAWRPECRSTGRAGRDGRASHAAAQLADQPRPVAVVFVERGGRNREPHAAGTAARERRDPGSRSSSDQEVAVARPPAWRRPARRGRAR